MVSRIHVYTDGSASPNPGPAGWAVVIVTGDKTEYISGHSDHATNNAMELTAAIQAVILLEGFPMRIHTDSEYVRVGIIRNVKIWMKNDWKTKTGEPIVNKELWQQLYERSRDLDIEWIHVTAHSNDVYNTLADKLAKEASKTLQN